MPGADDLPGRLPEQPRPLRGELNT